MSPASRRAATIELCLERVAEHGDPTPRVYERLFKLHPEMKDLFVRDTQDSVKGEMLARAFEALLDFVGERRYADHMIGTEMRAHEGYDVPREIFSTFFAVVAEVIREILGGRVDARVCGGLGRRAGGDRQLRAEGSHRSRLKI